MSEEPRIEGEDVTEEEATEAAPEPEKKPKKRGRPRKPATEQCSVRCVVANVFVGPDKKILEGETAEVSADVAEMLIENKQCERA